MTVETFTLEQFENYLDQHQPYKTLGIVDGEYTYQIPLDGQVSIMLRSSIKADGISAGTGKDSIRIWLVDNDGNPLGSKISKWTTRQPNWQGRLTENIKTLLEWRTLAGNCPECNRPKSIFKSRTETNKGRIFAKCKGHNGFQWLDEKGENNNVYFSGKQSHGNGSNVDDMGNVARQESSEQRDTVQSEDSDDGDTNAVTKARSEKSKVSNLSKPSKSQVELVKEPNLEQRQAIEADIYTNLRVLAPPGSGKTFIIEHRFDYLVQNGVSPEKIIVVTFNKVMADEMALRILKTCESAINSQISTIHALCYRLLCKWDTSSPYYGWQVPKSWQVKKTLEDIIGQVWSYGEKPGANAVLDYISTSKYLGLTVDDSYEWFVKTLGQDRGEWLYEIRSRFDAWLQRNRALTFADMLYLVEQRLKKDKVWRDGLQEKFSHVIVDESQDTNYQAMCILITISLEPGQNGVYEKRNDFF